MSEPQRHLTALERALAEARKPERERIDDELDRINHFERHGVDTWDDQERKAQASSARGRDRLPQPDRAMMARPRLDPEEAAEVRVTFLLTRQQRILLGRLAEARGMVMSEFIRHRLFDTDSQNRQTKEQTK